MLELAKRYLITANTLSFSVKYTHDDVSTLTMEHGQQVLDLATSKKELDELEFQQQKEQQLREEYDNKFQETLASFPDEPKRVKQQKQQLTETISCTVASNYSDSSGASEEEQFALNNNPYVLPLIPNEPLTIDEKFELLEEAKATNNIEQQVYLYTELAEYYKNIANKCWPSKVTESINYLTKSHNYLQRASSLVMAYPDRCNKLKESVEVVLFHVGKNLIKNETYLRKEFQRREEARDRAREYIINTYGRERWYKKVNFEDLSKAAKAQIQFEICLHTISQLNTEINNLKNQLTQVLEKPIEQGIFLGNTFFKSQPKNNKKTEPKKSFSVPEEAKKEEEVKPIYKIYPPEKRQLTRTLSTDSFLDKTALENKKCRYVFYTSQSLQEASTDSTSSQDLRKSM